MQVRPKIRRIHAGDLNIVRLLLMPESWWGILIVLPTTSAQGIIIIHYTIGCVVVILVSFMVSVARDWFPVKCILFLSLIVLDICQQISCSLPLFPVIEWRGCIGLLREAIGQVTRGWGVVHIYYVRWVVIILRVIVFSLGLSILSSWWIKNYVFYPRLLGVLGA